MDKFDEEYDVVVIGYGFAGGIAAIEACDAGASVLIVDKMPLPGGISIISGGGLRCADDADEAFAYLKATSAGRTPDDVLRALADGMAGAEAYVRSLAEPVGAEIIDTSKVKRGANYPFPGFRTFYSTKIASVPGYKRSEVYPHIRARESFSGDKLFWIVEQNVNRRNIAVRMSAPARRLIRNGTRAIEGIEVEEGGKRRTIRARAGVVLACGGFEFDENMHRQYFQAMPFLTVAPRSHTGDGVRMAQTVGADLWHMWITHGSYAFRHHDPQFPFALRTKRLPDWNPVEKDELDVKLAWIVVDQHGKRYMNEWPPYVQDTGHRPMDFFDTETQSYPRIPSFLVADEACRELYSLGDGISNDPEYAYDWSLDNRKEIELGILHQADSVAGLAEKMGVDPAALVASVDRWNALCETGTDSDFGRPPGSMMKIEKPPFIFGKVWPMISNTQGGPVHDARQRVIDVEGAPIPGLYVAGELGSAFGHLYLSGGNLAECFITGRIAGLEVTRSRNL